MAKGDVSDGLKKHPSAFPARRLAAHPAHPLHPPTPQTNTGLHFKHIAALLGNGLLCSLSPSLGDELQALRSCFQADNATLDAANTAGMHRDKWTGIICKHKHSAECFLLFYADAVGGILKADRGKKKKMTAATRALCFGTGQI